MKKAIILFFLVIIFTTAETSAREPSKGYRWFLDLNSEAIFQKKYSNDRDIVYSNSGLSTTHGYQFNRHFFLGGGIGFNVVTSNYDWFSLGFGIPAYAAGRADWKVGKVPLFADLRFGTFLNANHTNLFLNPSVGYHCSFGRKISLNIGVGLSVHWSDNSYKDHGKLMPSVKIGLDFN